MNTNSGYHLPNSAILAETTEMMYVHQKESA